MGVSGVDAGRLTGNANLLATTNTYTTTYTYGGAMPPGQ
jgi:hypothetical protein